jgi:class 3 adenylate cyclase/CHASE2 domain-containing sensor protein
MLSHFLKKRAVMGALIGLLITLVCTAGVFTGLFHALHLNVADSLYTRDEATSEIVIVAIDNESTDPAPTGLGRYSQWNREYYADALDRIEEDNPKVVAFDILFHTYTVMTPREKFLELEQELVGTTDEEKIEIYEKFTAESSDSLDNAIDNTLAETFAKYENLVLGAIPLPDGSALIQPIRKFREHAELGIANIPADEDGIGRESRLLYPISYIEEPYKKLSLSVLEKSNPEMEMPTEEFIKINYFGDPYSYKYVPFIDVYNDKLEPGIFADKIVLIGVTSAKEAHDEFLTPRSNTTLMPGVEIHANEIQTILEGKYIHDQSPIAQIITIAIIAIGLTIALNYLGIITAIILTIVALLAYLLAAHAFYDRGIILNMVYPFVAIVLSYLGSWVYKYFIADKGKREMKDAFSHYVSDKLVDEIAENPESVHLGGEKREITVFFSDIRGSTSYSEQIETEKWVAQMNEYFTLMEQVIKKYSGTLDKYEGDAIMGFWNAPITQENHQELAYMAAFGMQEALKLLHEKWKKEGKPLIEFRIGINTGQAIVGNFGSADRFDYTAMGDTVNTASRLEGSANKSYGIKMVISTESNELNEGLREKFLMREIDIVFLPGKKDPERIYELIAPMESASANEKNLVQTYERGLALYRSGNFDEAINSFNSLGEDSPSKIMAARCKTLASGGEIAELSGDYVFKIENK